MFNVLKRIDELGDARGITKYRISKETGIPQSTISTWYAKNSYPSIDKIEQICEVYGITLPEFFATPETIGDDNLARIPELGEKWFLLTGEQQKIMLKLMDLLVHKTLDDEE